jgi:hypothetical protein
MDLVLKHIRDGVGLSREVSMLSVKNKLDFPRIAHAGKSEWVSGSSKKTSTNVNLYNLDWSSGILMTVPRLSVGFIESLSRFKFKIDSNYMRQIKFHAKAAAECWDSPSDEGFDTVIRDWCREPAVAHVWAAFRLLGDCVYDPETKYFSREDSKVLASYMAYAFWHMSSVGYGLVSEFSRIDHERFSKSDIGKALCIESERIHAEHSEYFQD